VAVLDKLGPGDGFYRIQTVIVAWVMGGEPTAEVPSRNPSARNRWLEKEERVGPRADPGNQMMRGEKEGVNTNTSSSSLSVVRVG